MDYQAILAGCDSPEVGAAVASAVGQLFERDRKLLEIDVGERTVAERLARYLEPRFAGYNINVEYNRMGDAPKRVAWNEKADLVYPDIIVHLVGTETNILVIELKKDSNPEPKDDDILKLKAYRQELHYLHALFIRFGVGLAAGTVTECEWVEV